MCTELMQENDQHLEYILCVLECYWAERQVFCTAIIHLRNLKDAERPSVWAI